MKNKLEKTNKTKFDYTAKKLAIAGSLIMVIALAVLLPITATLNNNNAAINAQITTLNAEVKENSSRVSK